MLGGRDLLRKEQGTWLGMTKHGRIAILTNFREESVEIEAKSRGALVNAFLTQPADSPQSTEDFIKNLVHGKGLEGVGGLSLVCGKIGEPLAVISNRSSNAEDVAWIAKNKGETVGLSNAAFADRSWRKVLRGEELLASAIKKNLDDMAPRAALVDDLFELLSEDTLPKKQDGIGWETYVKELRHSILIPPIGGDGADHLSAEELATATSKLKVGEPAKQVSEGNGQSGVYGTQKQTVVIVDNFGCVIFVERTLYDQNGRSTAGSSVRDRQQRYDFFIEGWGEG